MGAKGKSGEGEKGHKHRGSRLIKRSIISSIIARHLVLLGSSGLIPWKGEREEEGNKLEKKEDDDEDEIQGLRRRCFRHPCRHAPVSSEMRLREGRPKRVQRQFADKWVDSKCATVDGCVGQTNQSCNYAKRKKRRESVVDCPRCPSSLFLWSARGNNRIDTRWSAIGVA